MKILRHPLDLLLCVALGCLSTWQIAEMDLFWMVRAGDDILRTHSIPMTETWTYSVPGTAWHNTHWLSEVLVRLAYGISGAAALVAFRGLVVILFLYVCARIIRQVVASALGADSSRVAQWIVAVLLPLLYMATYFRLELRADTFVLVLFATLILAWLRREVPAPAAGSAAVPPRRRLGAHGATILIVGGAAQLHAGTALFPLLLGLASIVVDGAHQRVSRRAGWCLAAVVAFFASPAAPHVLGFLYAHIFYHEGKVLTNPDHKALSWAHFGWHYGLTTWAWVAITSLAVIGWLVQARSWGLRGGIYSHRSALAVTVVAATALCFNRDRAIMYQVVLALPLAAHGLTRVAARWRAAPAASRQERKRQRPSSRPRYATALAIASAAAVNAIALPLHLSHVNRPFGFSVNPRVFPVRTTACLRRSAFTGNIYHTFTYGGYIVWYLRDHRHFGDPRETPFRSLETRYFAAYGSSMVAQGIYRDFAINALLTPIPGTQLIQGMGYRDILEEYNPRAEWALVCFDDISVGLLRRIPQHREAIAAHEYELLRPNLPVAHYFGSRRRTPARDRLFAAEAQRCLQEQPGNSYCNAAMGIYLARTSSQPEDVKRARRYLDVARGQRSRYQPEIERELAALETPRRTEEPERGRLTH